MTLCAWPSCRSAFSVCAACDVGRLRYCSPECAASARRRSVREAGKRYQKSRRGRALHAARQARYRGRQAPLVTHQSESDLAAPSRGRQAPRVTNKPESDLAGPATLPPAPRVTHQPESDLASLATPPQAPRVTHQPGNDPAGSATRPQPPHVTHQPALRATRPTPLVAGHVHVRQPERAGHVTEPIPRAFSRCCKFCGRPATWFCLNTRPRPLRRRASDQARRARAGPSA